MHCMYEYTHHRDHTNTGSQTNIGNKVSRSCLFSVALLFWALLFLGVIHAREPLYSKSAVIAWWSQSTSGENGVIMCTLLLKNVINFLKFHF